MEEPPASGVDAAMASSEAEVLVLHTADACEWATYLQQILKSSRKFRQRSVLLYELNPADRLHGYNYQCFQGCGCVLLLVTGELLDALGDPELRGALETVVSPPHRVVALLCGVTEEDEVAESFCDWASWRKISAEDDPHVYVSTILETITNNAPARAEHPSEDAEQPRSTTEDPSAGEKEEVSSREPIETTPEDEGARACGGEEESEASARLSCLAVRPSRVLCGTSEKLFIMFTHKVDRLAPLEVEFSSKSRVVQTVAGTLENEYTLVVPAPDLPPGVVSLSLRSDCSSIISLQPVTYYTHMGEISHLLENATDPVSFMCQAFNLTSNATECLDRMLTESLKCRLPATTFQLFGVSQIEEVNMATCQRKEELPTLLHFAAKYGLRELTAVLQGCPGALQAYSVMNKHGDYPNKLAEKSGFSHLRQLMEKFVDTAASIKPKAEPEQPISTGEMADVYEMMAGAAEDAAIISEDVYESMFAIDPECVEDLYEVMNAVDENPEEAMLRKFFQAKHPEARVSVDLESSMAKHDGDKPEEEEEEEEDPYNLTLEDIYDTVDETCAFNPIIQNRPPAPLPRPQPGAEPETPMIFRVFSDKSLANGGPTPGVACAAVKSVEQPPSPVYDPYAGMKTPGQRQLISLQERVKVGEITVDEAVNEFKAWKIDQEGRASSIRYREENLKRLRESITRRHKERQKAGKDLEYEISAPLQRNLLWGSNMTVECAVYESAPRAMSLPPPPPATAHQRSTWKTGSTSSTSSSGSNRLSTVSSSSGTEPDFEDMSEVLQPPPRPPRTSDQGATISPPLVPPRVPERVPDKMLHERYIPCPTRAVPQRPSQRHSDLAPPVPRRLR